MDCFGSDSEEENSSEPTQRDASCGICSFHPHTESSLLSHVRNYLAGASMDDGTMKTKADQVLNAVDEFCLQRHWMMHVGKEKGEILTNALKESIDKKLSEQSSDGTFVLVELGSYCGYSSILMAKECMAVYGNKLNLKLITLEINPDYIAIARELMKLSGLEDVISLLEISYNGHDTNMVELVQEELLESKGQTIDLLFIDHDKDSYKSDLTQLETSRLIRNGTRVVADNVVFAKIDDYIGYMQKREHDGVVTTKTVACHVEYSNNELAAGENSESLADGIGKLSLLVNGICLELYA